MGGGQERILSWPPFIEIRIYGIVCLAQTKTSILYLMQLLYTACETLALLKSIVKIIVFSWSRISLLFLVYRWIFMFLYKYLSR